MATSLAATGLVVGPAMSAELTVSVEIPRLSVAEYHRPYVAFWIENKARKQVTNLAVWYDFKLKDDEGTKWLKDLRQWWRTTGRDLKMPADGLTSATRAPGEHSVSFAAGASPLGGLAPGKYEFVVEAAREVGGRELLRIPIEWPPAAAVEQKSAGEQELGTVKVVMKP
jgi:hypothetical protein